MSGPFFKKVKDQKRASLILERFLNTKRIPSALLFTGMEGIGKTLMASEFAKALLCREQKSDPTASCGFCSDCVSIDNKIHPDVKIVDAQYQANFREEEQAKQKTLRVETLRHLRRDMEMLSFLGSWKVAIVADAHTLELEAANALLKILEEPPPQTLWILVTPQRERLLKTVQSRCFAIPFAPLSPKTVKELLLARGIEGPKAEMLSQFSEGSVSRALELAALPETVTASALADNPLAAMTAAEALPRELYLARVQVEMTLFSLAQDLRLKHLKGQLGFHLIEKPLQKLSGLRQALKTNADPRLVLTLAGALGKAR